MLLLGVGLGWLGSQLRWIQKRNEARRWIYPLQERQMAVSTGAPVPPKKGIYVQRSVSAAPWSLAVLGEVGVERIELNARGQSNDKYSTDRLQSLFPEAEIVEAKYR